MTTTASRPDPEAAAAAPDVLVIVAHPQLEQSHVNRTLMRAASALQGAAPMGDAAPPRSAAPTRDAAAMRSPAPMGDAFPTFRAAPRLHIEVRDLYALYPDYLIDVAAEQRRLAAARLIVWQHPIHWYHMPPLMKLWVDEVLTFGWAYGPGGTALRGKDLWLVASTGGTEESYRPDGYNRYFFDAFLPPYEQTAALCGMRFLPPMIVSGAHRLSELQAAEQAALYAQRLARYPDWPELVDGLDGPQCEVPVGARPTDRAEIAEAVRTAQTADTADTAVAAPGAA